MLGSSGNAPALVGKLEAAGLLAVGFEASSASALAARQEATASQIVKQVAKRQGRHLQPEDTAALYLATSSASLARAELQERAGRFVEGAGGHLEETQFTSSPEQETDGTVAIQPSLAIGNNALRDSSRRSRRARRRSTSST